MVVSFRLPSRILIGEKAIKEAPNVLKKYECKRTIIVTDNNVYNIAGKYLEELLLDHKVDTDIHVIQDSTIEEVNKVRKIISRYSKCTVIGLGGGKSIDVAKYSSFLEKNNFISIPTSISHDGIASPIVALKDKELKPLSIFTQPPEIVIADLSIISNAPMRLLRSGFADIIGKITSVRDAYLAIKMKNEHINEYSLFLAKTSYNIAIKYSSEIAKKTLTGIKALTEAAITSGMAMSVAGSSRPCSGSEHLFSHALDKLYPHKKSLHGEQVGVGTIVMAYFQGINWRKIKELLKKVGAPTSAKELGVPDEIVIKAIAIAHTLRKRYTILGEGGIDEKAAEKAARIVGIID